MRVNTHAPTGRAGLFCDAMRLPSFKGMERLSGKITVFFGLSCRLVGWLLLLLLLCGCFANQFFLGNTFGGRKKAVRREQVRSYRRCKYVRGSSPWNQKGM